MHSLQRLNEKHSIVTVAIHAVVSMNTLSLEQELPLHRGLTFLSRRTARAATHTNSDRRVCSLKYEEGPASEPGKGKTFAVRVRPHNAMQSESGQYSNCYEFATIGLKTEDKGLRTEGLGLRGNELRSNDRGMTFFIFVSVPSPGSKTDSAH